MAAPVNAPENVYILDKSAAYGQIQCRLARYRQSDPKVQRLMLKLEQHQPISRSTSVPKVTKFFVPGTEHDFTIEPVNEDLVSVTPMPAMNSAHDQVISVCGIYHILQQRTRGRSLQITEASTLP